MINPPYLRVLTDDEVQQVYQASLRILAETGMVVDHERARQMLEGAGARVDHAARMVYFAPDLVVRQHSTDG
jgi:trimethylamine:corrinoid methyltransferase-like protein